MGRKVGFIRVHFVLRAIRLYILANFWYFLGPNQRLLHSPRHPPLAYSEMSLPGLLAGPPLLGAQEVPPEWAFSCVYLLLAVLQEYIYSISCLSLLLTRDLFGSCPGLIGVGEQGGALGGSLGAQAVRDSRPTSRPKPPNDSGSPPTSWHFISSLAALLTPVS